MPPPAPPCRLNLFFCHAMDETRMNAHMQVPEEWRNWIAHNLERGCDLEMLVADMLRAGRDFAVVVVRLWRTRSPSKGC